MILCFSLSCKKQKTKETSIKQLRGTVHTAHTLFSSVKVVVPPLIRLNKFVACSFLHIQPLDDNLFETTASHLWTKDTATVYFTHWVSYLNLQAS